MQITIKELKISDLGGHRHVSRHGPYQAKAKMQKWLTNWAVFVAKIIRQYCHQQLDSTGVTPEFNNAPK